MQQPVAVAQPPVTVRMPRINEPGPDEVRISGQTQELAGPWTYLRGDAVVESEDTILQADEIDHNEETGYAEARGNVRFRSFSRGEKIEADRAEYFFRNQKGRFWNVRGTIYPEIDFRPGLLITNSPFLFEARWAERDNLQYTLYDGTITDCRTPRPWWYMRGPRFTVVPGKHAIGYHSRFLVKRIPLFYSPVFYKSLESQPRKSGFLMPSAGFSNRYGKVVRVGYFWALNRSYDLLYQGQLLTQRGFAHNATFRGKPTQSSYFDAYIHGVNDRGFLNPDGTRGASQGGFLLSVTGKADFGHGFTARGELRYLSSFIFRQAFTDSFNEAVFSEVHSRGFVAKSWSTYSFGLVLERNENYQSTNPGDRIVIRKLPEVDFSSRERLISEKGPPVWVSFESSAGLVRRNQPLFQTRQFVERIDLAPRIMSAFRLFGFNLIPAFSVRETQYGSSLLGGKLSGDGVLRSARDLSLELIPPSLSRVFDNPPKWLGGSKLKHVIEPRAGFRYVSGIQDFSRLIRFDETEVLTNTKEVDYSLSQRLLVKKGTEVSEVLTWQVWQKRYFDPTLGGTVVPGQRNIVATQLDITPYGYFFEPRRYSPIISSLRGNPTNNLGFEWRADYDPLRERIVNSSLLGSWRGTRYTIQAGHNNVRSDPRLSPSANQFLGILSYGRPDQRGFGAGFLSVYDFRTSVMQFATAQFSYNSECCGLSVQYRRLQFGTQDRWEFRVAFAVANIGSFGTLRRQERIF